MRKTWILLVIPLAFGLIGADQPSASPSPPAGSPAPAATATVAPPPPPAPPGMVTSVVDPSLLPRGKNVLHGITRDPKTGDLIIGVSNFIAHVIPMVTTTFSNDDSLRRITAAGTVSQMTSTAST